MKDANLEELKNIFGDDRPHLEVARVDEIAISNDNSVMRVRCTIVPDNFEVVARVTWDQVGEGDGDFGPINVTDLVLLGFTGDGQAFVMRRLSSKADKLPEMLNEGHSIKRALPGKKLYLGSNIKTLVQKVGSLVDPTENIVLGQVLKTLLSEILAELALQAQNIIEHTHTGNYGVETSPPLNATDFSDNKSVFEAKKASPVDDELMLSDIFFTEKGT